MHIIIKVITAITYIIAYSIKKNVLGYEYVNAPADNISSRCEASRSTSLYEKQTLNKAKSLTYPAGTRRSTISKTGGQSLEPM
jgi:hypothetical protein